MNRIHPARELTDSNFVGIILIDGEILSNCFLRINDHSLVSLAKKANAVVGN